MKHPPFFKNYLTIMIKIIPDSNSVKMMFDISKKFYMTKYNKIQKL